MAGSSSTPDIRLLFGVQGDGAISGASGAEIKKRLSEIVDAINKDPFKIKFTADQESLNQLRRQIEELRNSVQSTVGLVAGGSTGAGRGDNIIREDYTRLFSALSRIESLRGSINTSISKAKLTPDIQGIGSQQSALEDMLRGLDRLQDRLIRTDMTQEEFSTSLISIGLSAKTAKNEINKLVAEMKLQKSTQQGLTEGSKGYIAAEKSISKIVDDIAAAQNKFAGNKNASVISATNELTDYSKRVEQLSIQLKNGELSQKQFNDSIREIRSGVDTAMSSLNNYNKVWNSMQNQFSGILKTVGSYYTTYRLITSGINTVKSMISQATELDRAFADVRIVTHSTAEELQQYSETIANVAQETSTSMNDLISATTTYARLGYDLDESTLLAKYTGMLEKVGDIDAQKAEAAVTSIIKAFPDDVDIENIEQAMDKLVATGNNFPISVEQIAEGMTNASSAMSAAGNTFDETVALLTAANTTVQNASKASTALRTIAARLRKTKTELDDLGESMEESTYEGLVSALTEHNVALTTIEGEYRSTFDIMQDIAAHWNEMTNMEQAAIAEAVAGTRQQTVFYSIVENFQEATGAMEMMEGSAGALSDSYSVHMDTIEAHTNKFHTAWQQLSMDVVNSDVVKSFVDIGTTLLNVADKMQKVHLLLPAILASINAIKAIKLVSSMNKAHRAASAFVDDIIYAGSANKVLTKRFMELSVAQQKEVASMLAARAAVDKDKAAKAKDAMVTAELISENEALEASNYGLKASFGAILLSNPLGWITTAVSLLPAVVGIVGRIKGLFSDTKDVVEQARSLEEITQDINNATSSFKDTKEAAEDLIPRYVELSKGVDEYGNNIGLTDDAFKEFWEVQNKIADMFPNLNTGIDENGNAMLRLKDASGDLTEQLVAQLEIQKQLSHQTVADTIPELTTGLNDTMGKMMPNVKVMGVLSAINALLDPENIKEIDESRPEYTAANTLNKFFTLYGTTSAEAEGLLGSDTIELALAAARGDVAATNAVLEQIQKVYTELIETYPELRGYTSALTRAYGSWMQIDKTFTALPKDLQNVAIRMEGMIDPTKFLGMTPEEIYQYIRDTILIPLNGISEDGHKAISNLVENKAAFEAGKIGAKEFENNLKIIKSTLQAAGVDADTLTLILDTADCGDYLSQIESIRRALKSSGNDTENIEEFLTGLSMEDFKIAYQILTEDGSMTIDELVAAIERAKMAAAKMIEVEDFTKMFDKLGDVTKNLDKVSSAMEKLKKGTALTKVEMLKLAEQFPELLKQSNLFTSGSIAGQEKLLRVVMESYKKEQDAVIDAKITELEASITAVKNQILVEKAKLVAIMKMDDEDLKNKETLNTLEAMNFVELKNNELSVNEQTMNKTSEETVEILNGLVGTSWKGYSDAVIDIMNTTGKSSVAATGNMAMSINDILKELNWEFAQTIFDNLTGAARDALIRDALNAYNASSANMKQIVDNAVSGFHSAGKIKSPTKISPFKSSIFEKILPRYKSSQISDYIGVLESHINELESEIGNLQALKNMSLDEFIASFSSGNSSSSSGSSSSSSSSNWFTDAYNEHKHKVAMGEETTAEFLKWLKDALKQATTGANAVLSESDAYKYFEELKKGMESLADSAKSTLDNLVQYRMKVIKDQRQKEKDALKQNLSDLKEYYDKQKQMLQDNRDEEKYLEEQAEKRKSVADIRSDIARLKYDNSAWAQKRIIELTEELNEAEKELNDFEKDHALDAQLEFIDSEYERVAKEIESAVEKIDEALNDPTALYNQALIEIESGTKSIYEEMKEYAQQNGNGSSNEAYDLWKKTVDALSEYTKFYGSDFINGQGHILRGYASGTSSASRGLHRVNETGAEVLFTSANGHQYRLFSGGEKVLNADASNFLYNFATEGATLMSGSNRNSSIGAILSGKSGSPVVNLGDIIINGNADHATVSEIRRAQRENVEMILNAFNRLRH